MVERTLAHPPTGGKCDKQFTTGLPLSEVQIYASVMGNSTNEDPNTPSFTMTPGNPQYKNISLPINTGSSKHHLDVGSSETMMHYHILGFDVQAFIKVTEKAYE
ncbi:hypothetical protein VNI00_008831 [Paramarasmius palmivorus]|uniref:Plastocyanin-like domain-containing protein n=1 Tax=Paramarasmius palmivorus TaxID=297713 RepID=A0AAW0CP86_9AGAR